MTIHHASFTRSALWALTFLIGFALMFVVYDGSERSIDEANRRRYQSRLLADELRQSSDDLTSMVRSFGAGLSKPWPSATAKPPSLRTIPEFFWDSVKAGLAPQERMGTQPGKQHRRGGDQNPKAAQGARRQTHPGSGRGRTGQPGRSIFLRPSFAPRDNRPYLGKPPREPDAIESNPGPVGGADSRGGPYSVATGASSRQEA